MYSITEGETITVCARITGPDKIDEQFLILATLNATNVGSAILGIYLKIVCFVQVTTQIFTIIIIFQNSLQGKTLSLSII